MGQEPTKLNAFMCDLIEHLNRNDYSGTVDEDEEEEAYIGHYTNGDITVDWSDDMNMIHLTIDIDDRNIGTTHYLWTLGYAITRDNEPITLQQLETRIREDLE